MKWEIIKKDKVIFCALLLLAIFIVGIFYSSGSLKYTMQGFFKYTKVLFLLFLIPLFAAHCNWRKIAENALIAGVFLTIVFSLLNVNGIAVFGRIAPVVGGYFVHQLYASALLAFTLFILIHRIFDKDKFLWLYILLFLLGFYVLYFIYIERTGYIIGIGLFSLFILQRLKWQALVSLLIIIPLLVTAIYTTSPTFHKRTNEIFSDIVSYQQNKKLTSVGYRLAFAEYSFKIIKSHPLLGTGTGSFSEMYKNAGGPDLTPGMLLGHPHNEYLFIAVQTGILGLLAFLIWIFVQIIESYALPFTEKRLVQGVILAFVINSFTNASLSINTTGMTYIVFLSIYFAARYASKPNLKKPSNKTMKTT
jgi:O-antigen ligase